jgi:N-acetyl sugar amidotransferase
MEYCVRCVMPNTKPGVFLDERGLCNACRSQEMKRKVDWKSRRKELEAIIDEIKVTNTSSYDCLVPVSGGKNSWYQAWMMKEVFGMKVLCCVMAPHLPTTEGIYNLNQMVDSIGLDIIKITLKPSVYKKIRKKAFIRQGEPNWPEHMTVFAGVTNVAQIYDIPLIVWGEDVAFEFGGIQTQESKADASDIDNNDLIKDKTIDDFIDNDISKRDTFFYRYPDLKSSDGKGVKSIYLGYYDFWEGRKHLELCTSMGFKSRVDGPLSGNYLDYDNIDEKLCEINIWLKYIKFGFWRPTDQVCYDIWNGKLSREDAVEIVNKLQNEFPQEYFEDFLQFHNISEQEFWETVEKFRNLDIWKKNQHGEWKLKVKLQ